MFDPFAPRDALEQLFVLGADRFRNDE